MIDINKKYRYADGNGKARILCTDRQSEDANYPVVSMDIYGGLYCHQENGVCRYDRKFDLIEVKEKKVQYLNIYEDHGDHYGYSASTLQRCIEDHNEIAQTEGTLLARVRVEWEEGYFDE